MAIDFSSIQGEPAKTGKLDFTTLGAMPAVQGAPEEDTTALGAAGRGAAGMLPLGNQAYSAIAGAAENKPYLQERQELEKEVQSDRASHELARLVGQAAGLAAPAILTGGASAPASLGEAALQGAGMGAGFGAGNALDTLAAGGSGTQAAGQVALGAGLGAAGGAIGQKIAGALKGTVPSVEEYAAKKAAQGVGMGSKELGNMSQQELIDTGNMLMDKNIVKPGASTQEMFNTAKAIHESYGDAIGKIGNQATELGLTTDTKPLLDALGEKYQAATQLSNPDEVRNALWYKRGMADIITMARQNGAERVAPDIATEQPASFVTFDQLQKLKRSYGNSAFENGAVKNPAAADIYGQLSAGQKAIVNKAADNPNLPARLKDAMTGYSKLYPVVDGLQDVLGRERAGNLPTKGFGMIGKLVGQLPGQKNTAVNALTSLGLLGAGHPLWAVGAATATLQNPRAMAGLAQKAARAIPSLAGALPTAGAQIGGATEPSATALNVNHPALAQWKPIFDKNAATAQNPEEIKKSQAVTDFILSQRDPAYAKAKQQASDSPVAENKAPNLRMADGGVIDEPHPELGSTLQGFADQLKSPTHEKPPVPMEDLPANNSQKLHQPFNTDMADKLKAFFKDKEDEADGQSR